ncbi:MAG: hypothetical protein D3911_15175 [Candidatus Electrothrix sp. AW3_4]|nr:hypothetical protein [Candidatus Electrothrix gigas]
MKIHGKLNCPKNMGFWRVVYYVCICYLPARFYRTSEIPIKYSGITTESGKSKQKLCPHIARITPDTCLTARPWSG